MIYKFFFLDRIKNISVFLFGEYNIFAFAP